MDGLYDDIMQERIRAQAKSVHSGIIWCDSVPREFQRLLIESFGFVQGGKG